MNKNSKDNDNLNKNNPDKKSKNLIDMDEIEDLIRMDKKINKEEDTSNEERSSFGKSGVNTDYSQKNKSKFENTTNTKSKKRKKTKKTKYTFRRLSFLIILFVIFYFIISSTLSFFGKGKSKASETPSLAVWYLGQFAKESRGEYSSTPTSLNSIEDANTIAYSRARDMNKKIMPNSNHLVSAESYAYNTKEIRQYIRGEVEYTGKEKLVFLTFDDGPNSTVTPKILDILNKKGVHGTFFTVGKNITEDKYSILKQVLMNGNAIAMHSFSHDYDLLYPEKIGDVDKIIEEAQLTSNRLTKVFGDDFKSTVWRYPGGHLSWQGLTDADKKLREMGIEWIDWNSLSGDAATKSQRPTTSDGELENVINSLNKNLHSDVAVILMHDATNKDIIIESLPKIIDYFKENNYKFCILK